MGPYGFRYDPTLGSMGLYGAIWVPPWSHYWVSTGLYGSIWVPLRSLWLLLWNLWDSLLATGPTLCPYGSLWGSTRLTEGRHHPPLLGAAMTPRASLPAQSGSRPQTGEKRRGWKVGGGGGSFWDQKPPFGVGAERPETALRGPEGAKEEKERLKGGAHRRGDPAEPQRFDEGGGGGRRPLLRWGPTAPFRRAPFCPSAGHGPSREGF